MLHGIVTQTEASKTGESCCFFLVSVLVVSSGRHTRGRREGGGPHRIGAPLGGRFGLSRGEFEVAKAAGGPSCRVDVWGGVGT